MNRSEAARPSFVRRMGKLRQRYHIADRAVSMAVFALSEGSCGGLSNEESGSRRENGRKTGSCRISKAVVKAILWSIDKYFQ